MSYRYLFARDEALAKPEDLFWPDPVQPRSASLFETSDFGQSLTRAAICPFSATPIHPAEGARSEG